MRSVSCLACGVGIVLLGQLTEATAGAPAYVSLDQWNVNRARIVATRQLVLSEPSVRSLRADARPQLVEGLRTRHVEILQDALLRKHPRLLRNSAQKARELIPRRYSHNRSQLYGIMAEAMFIDRNPEWGYVQKPNASQHDVYRWMPGRQTPSMGQIKFHISGRPAQYAWDMRNDHRSERFLIPDDHVAPTKAYLSRQAVRLQATGNTLAAQAAWRNWNRIDGLGATSGEIVSSTSSAQRAVLREKAASYQSLGAAIALSVGPTIWDWSQGRISSDSALSRSARPLSLLGVGVGSELLLQRLAGAGLRGGMRSHAIVGAVLFIADLGWTLNEHGWRTAFYRAEFYEDAAGSVSSLALGLSVGAYAAAAASPGGPVVAGGAGIIAGTTAGAAGYFGGRSAARMILAWQWPELVQQQEREQIQAVRTRIENAINAATRWTVR
jgi:hypothetical protein